MFSEWLRKQAVGKLDAQPRMTAKLQRAGQHYFLQTPTVISPSALKQEWFCCLIKSYMLYE